MTLAEKQITQDDLNVSGLNLQYIHKKKIVPGIDPAPFFPFNTSNDPSVVFLNNGDFKPDQDIFIAVHVETIEQICLLDNNYVKENLYCIATYENKYMLFNVKESKLLEILNMINSVNSFDYRGLKTIKFCGTLNHLYNIDTVMKFLNMYLYSILKNKPDTATNLFTAVSETFLSEKNISKFLYYAFKYVAKETEKNKQCTVMIDLYTKLLTDRVYLEKVLSNSMRNILKRLNLWNGEGADIGNKQFYMLYEALRSTGGDTLVMNTSTNEIVDILVPIGLFNRSITRP